MGGVGVDEAANPRTNPGRISANMLIFYVPQAMLTCTEGSLGESCNFAQQSDTQSLHNCATLFSACNWNSITSEWG